MSRSARWGASPAEINVSRWWYRYLIVYLKYVAMSHTNKQLALLCDLPLRQVSTIRNQSLAAVARRLVAWEQQRVHLTAPSVHGGEPPLHVGTARLQQCDRTTQQNGARAAIPCGVEWERSEGGTMG